MTTSTMNSDTINTDTMTTDVAGIDISIFPLSQEQLDSFERDGFLAVSGIFSTQEVDELREHFMEMQRQGLDESSPIRQFYQPVSAENSGGDILKQFPRIMHPHRFDELSKKYMLDQRIGAILAQLYGETPLASQSMFYFKPAGARGQALHQDNFYLNVRPGTCMAAWVSIDDADAENGGMFMVPGSHRHGIQCPRMADMEKSFTTEEVPIPEGLEAVQIPLKAGDVLFFNGAMIHGSTPNTSTDRFRRAFICHYVSNSMTGMGEHYYPLHDFEGRQIERERISGYLNTCGAEDWETYAKLRNEFLSSSNIAASVH